MRKVTIPSRSIVIISEKWYRNATLKSVLATNRTLWFVE